MSWPLFLACGWIVVAGVIAMVPSRRHHWPQAYGLIAPRLPILRWPVRYPWHWLRRQMGQVQ